MNELDDKINEIIITGCRNHQHSTFTEERYCKAKQIIQWIKDEIFLSEEQILNILDHVLDAKYKPICEVIMYNDLKKIAKVLREEMLKRLEGDKK